MTASKLFRSRACGGAKASGVQLVIAAALLFISAGLEAAQVPDLYQAEVALPEGGKGLDKAFATALSQVVVKLTGRRAAGGAVIVSQLGDPAAMVEQYRNVSADRIAVGFDAAALRRALDRAGLPVWAEERPATLVWLATDRGQGQRDILSSADGRGRATGSSARRLLLNAGKLRGLPLILPLVDAQDRDRLSFADLWGDFTDPVLKASTRYRADAVLIGRARGADPRRAEVRWTLLSGGQRMDWTGTVASGPDEAADRLAMQLAADAGSERRLRVAVAGLASFDAYGAISAYLSGLSNVQSCDVVEVFENRAIFAVQVRGNADQLMRTIALGRLLAPADPDIQGAIADLYYEFVGG